MDRGAPFCLDHWIMVPLDVRMRMATTKARSTEWLLAATCAVTVIALEEARTSPEVRA